MYVHVHVHGWKREAGQGICVRTCMCMCMGACVRACVRACVHVQHAAMGMCIYM